MNTGLLSRKLRGYERGVLIRILRKVKGNVRMAAAVAGRNSTEFYRMLKKHALKPKVFKEVR